jgi:hypothetical protein
MLLLYKGWVGSILDYASVFYSDMARTHTEKKFFFSFEFRLSTEKCQKCYFFKYLQIVVCTVLDRDLFFFHVFVLGVHYILSLSLSLRIALGLLQSTPNNSLVVLSGVSPLAERCMYLPSQ